MTDDTDENLMLKYSDGETSAFELLYQRHKGGLYRYLLRQCKNTSYAEEIFQETWMNVIKSRKKYSVKAQFKTYLFRIAHNRLIDHYRRSQSGLPSSYTDDSSNEIEGAISLQPEYQAGMLKKGETLLNALSLLPDAQRETFLLREESGLDITEIAEISGVNRETVKSRLRYALKNLKKLIGET